MSPGRKPIDELIAEEQKKADEARAKIAALKLRQRAASRKKDAHRKIIVGGAIMAHMRIDAEFRKAAQDALNKAVSDPKHRAEIPDLLDEKAFALAMKAEAKQAAIEAKEAKAEKQAPPPKPPAQ